MNGGAYFIQPQIVKDPLQEKVTDIKGVAVILCDKRGRGEIDGDILVFQFFLLCQESGTFFCPFHRVTTCFFTDFLFAAQFFNSNGMFNTFGIVVGFDDVKACAKF